MAVLFEEGVPCWIEMWKNIGHFLTKRNELKSQLWQLQMGLDANKNSVVGFLIWRPWAQESCVRDMIEKFLKMAVMKSIHEAQDELPELLRKERGPHELQSHMKSIFASLSLLLTRLIYHMKVCVNNYRYVMASVTKARSELAKVTEEYQQKAQNCTTEMTSNVNGSEAQGSTDTNPNDTVRPIESSLC